MSELDEAVKRMGLDHQRHPIGQCMECGQDWLCAAEQVRKCVDALRAALAAAEKEIERLIEDACEALRPAAAPHPSGELICGCGAVPYRHKHAGVLEAAPQESTHPWFEGKVNEELLKRSNEKFPESAPPVGNLWCNIHNLERDERTGNCPKCAQESIHGPNEADCPNCGRVASISGCDFCEPQESAPTPSLTTSSDRESTVGVPSAGSEQADLPLGHEFVRHGDYSTWDNCQYCVDDLHATACGKPEAAHRRKP